jgi:crotonobetainyl-CoA:carnitine CoA-transferase CaiB-like acyl-CoA transferase
MIAAVGDLLEGVRVVDLTDGYGALSARVLGDLGAEVVRVEAPDGGDGHRREPCASDGTSLHHAYRNAGKSVLTLEPPADIDADTDTRRTVDGLLAGADVVIVANGWGSDLASLAPAALSERHGHLVVVALTPFGLTGPAASWAATELVAQAMAGVVYRSGVPDLAPVSAPGSYCEDVGAVTAAMAAVIAVFQARRQGYGQLVDVSAVLSLAQTTDTALPLWSLLRSDQTRQGAGLYPLFACTDGLARIVLPMTAGDWRNLITWMGSPPEWTGPEWEKALPGPAERVQVLARLPERFAACTREEITVDGEAAGLRITPVLTPAEVLANEHVVQRGTFAYQSVGTAGMGAVMAGLFGVNGERSSVTGTLCPLREAPDWGPRRAPTGGRPQPSLPLAGLTVLELGSGVASPEAGRVLGEWGAEAIKVESRRRPDFQRVVMGGDMNPAFASPNRNKLCLGVNLGHDEGKALVRQLVPHVDIVLENNATGVLDRLGLGWDVLHAANPRLVLVSTQLYGDRGPWAWRKGYGPSARAVGALTWLWAHGPDAPRGVMTIHPDHLAGRLGALGAVAGLLARERTGIGSRVDIAQFEAVIALLGDLLLAESLEPGTAQPVGNANATHAPWDVFRCADDGTAESWLALCVTSDAGWAAVRAIAGGRLIDEPRWSTEAGRRADRQRLHAAVGGWLRDTEAGPLERSLQAAGVAAAQLLHPRLQAAHAHLVARGFIVSVDQPGSGPLLFEGPAFVGHAMAPPRCEPAPLPGQHTARICRERLGLDDTEIERLVAVGALDPTTEGDVR